MRQLVSNSLTVLALLVSGTVLFADAALAQTSDLVSRTSLRVCADPGNDPMSDDGAGGFENRLAELLADRLDLPLEYSWYPMSTGFIRNTLIANKCDLVIGYAQGHEMVLNTNHYFTSSYVLIVPRQSGLTAIHSLSDPALQGLKIGIIAATPPSSHLVRHGLMAGAKPYALFVDRRHQSPAQDMLEDLRNGKIDIAILWGPIGGPLVKRDYPEFMVTPLLEEALPPRLFFRITMGVRQGEKLWARRLNSLLRRNRKEIEAILSEAGVPLLNDMGTGLLIEESK